ncbi:MULTISPECIES: pseudaminic acid biosynthesis protein PseG [unclassified Pseudoalteromonas]|uniref:pseudaminic acid biosynthesis protein PseG n=1 Tax=unclassified Pseudoalteromonas TaxID=194690 RepID=UPI002097E166|nr:pseudaminic acid biosynthesis protein PseG [Pseudoalteromonas sp. XMcav2-N]MCO7190026.1 pseudaminic acid biosynthesis protein PseG [Pseudoalteromonas sp. XMcav2-N]
MIAIRVDTRCGMGHFMRMKWLAKALIEQHQRVMMLVDANTVPARFYHDLDVGLIEVPQQSDTVNDAQFALDALSQRGETASRWVVDGYGFDVRWEQLIRQTGATLLAMDDLARAHVADLVVDAKWQGLKTAARYEGKLAQHSQTLLGPDYCILAPEYRQLQAEVRDGGVLFSLGGGGDWHVPARWIFRLLETPPCGLESMPIQVVIGPKATNTEQLYTLAAKHRRLTLIEQATSLASYYQRCGLFVGALGTSLYELAATQTPALSFSLAVNQDNEMADLEALGHYLHIPDLLAQDTHKVVELIATLYSERKRVQQLCTKAAINVDGLGARRIASALLNGTGAGLTAPQGGNEQPDTSWTLAGNLQLFPVADVHINRYLRARNRSDNAWRMTITERINEVEHYRWWFRQTRDSFVLLQGDEPLLYVWHQCTAIEGQAYLFGGWFAASDAVNFVHAQLILQWQLTLTGEVFPDAVWVAVINKQNRFVNLLNERAGFVALAEDEPGYKAVQQLFPDASHQDFNFVAKYPMRTDCE